MDSLWARQQFDETRENYEDRGTAFVIFEVGPSFHLMKVWISLRLVHHDCGMPIPMVFWFGIKEDRNLDGGAIPIKFLRDPIIHMSWETRCMQVIDDEILSAIFANEWNHSWLHHRAL
ncbi:hypothetical protein QAD02_009215 [Eretmocerus hayati]|uniref:Uncharacterized protein n=1 Tax=Eretmocerus hayati TaxID=131215 RepID=A0ACC2N900_9HYME|nr:hypothetical protein QAD02_009215 [Eretmocerus hayati]